MAQQINLFDLSLRPERPWLTPPRLLVALLLVLAAMAGVAQALRSDAARWRAQAAADEAQLRQLAAAQPTAAAADAELPRLREQVAQARLLAAALQSPDAARPDEAARVLAALSAAALPGVWIDGAQWQAQPRQLSLEGGLLQGDRLPSYLRRLEGQAAFAGQSFAQLQLRPAEGSAATQTVPHHRFVLRSQPREGTR